MASSVKITIQNLPAIVGRDGTADVKIDDPVIAPYQCMIAKNGGNALTVWNLREESPIWVNDRQTLKATLFPGDRVRLGKTQFIVDYNLPGRPCSATSPSLKADNESRILAAS